MSSWQMLYNRYELVMVPAGDCVSLLRWNSPPMCSGIIIGLTGRNGSGKGTVAAWLMRVYQFQYSSLSDAIRRDLKASGIPETRDNLIARGNELRTEGGNGVLASKTIDYIKSSSGNQQRWVVDSIRHPAEACLLREGAKKIGYRYLLLNVIADDLVRYERIRSRSREGDIQTFEEFRQQEQKELGSTEGTSSAQQQLLATAGNADESIDNSSDMEALEEQLSQRVQEWIRSEE